MIDTHCHVDQYKDPIRIVRECEEKDIFTIAVTNLPSHFELGYLHVSPFKNVRLALGMHPLYAEQHHSEFNIFLKNLSKTSFIGEIGLDFSREGIQTKDIQLSSFNNILSAIGNGRKIISLHSRRAEKEVLNLLIKHKTQNAIFHWYSGPVNLIQDIVDAGFYFSINSAMTQSKNGCDIIKKIPLGRILTESDGPYVEVEGKEARPADLALTIKYLSEVNLNSFAEMESVIESNFRKLINKIR